MSGARVERIVRPLAAASEGLPQRRRPPDPVDAARNADLRPHPAVGVVVGLAAHGEEAAPVALSQAYRHPDLLVAPLGRVPPTTDEAERAAVEGGADGVSRGGSVG
jgi:hypothetical protein